MKYKVTQEKATMYGVTLYRIEATKDFGEVKKGMKGGFVENESNLSQDGNCWIAGTLGLAYVFGGAVISENAEVMGRAIVNGKIKVSGNVKICGNCILKGNGELSGSIILN